MSNFRTFVCEIVTVHGWDTRIQYIHASEVQDKTGKGNAAKNLDTVDRSNLLFLCEFLNLKVRKRTAGSYNVKFLNNIKYFNKIKILKFSMYLMLCVYPIICVYSNFLGKWSAFIQNGICSYNINT